MRCLWKMSLKKLFNPDYEKLYDSMRLLGIWKGLKAYFKRDLTEKKEPLKRRLFKVYTKFWRIVKDVVIFILLITITFKLADKFGFEEIILISLVGLGLGLKNLNRRLRELLGE